MSARVRTTIVATAVVALALLLAAAGLLVALRRSMIAHLEDVADVRASDVAALVDDETLPRRLSPATEDDDLVRVVADDGTVLASSTGYTTHHRHVTTARARGATVYVATSLQPVDDALGALAVAMLVGGPLLLVLVAALTWVLAGRALARVEASTERQRRFVADASHELRTPLSAMRVDLEVAMRHPDQPASSALLGDLLETTTSMERLVDDLLFLARTDAAVERPTQAFDLDDVVLEEVARTHEPVVASASSGAEVVGRRDEIARVIRNLLDNALRHARSRVAVAVVAGTDAVVLTVADDGPGISADDREQVFGRFRRADDSRTRADGGTGLGLAIAREIVESHGGRISIDDTDEGATFRVTLPSVG